MPLKDFRPWQLPGALDRLMERWVDWSDRRVEKALDKAKIGSERVVGVAQNDYLYEPHGCVPVEHLVLHTGAGAQNATRYRKMHEADPEAVAKLHRSSEDSSEPSRR